MNKEPFLLMDDTCYRVDASSEEYKKKYAEFRERTKDYSQKFGLERNDYNVIVCRILAYLYACLKSGSEVDESVISADSLNIAVPYWEYIFRHLSKGGYIKGVVSYNVVGRSEPMIKLSDVRISLKGIEYFDGDALTKAKDYLRRTKEITPGL